MTFLTRTPLLQGCACEARTRASHYSHQGARRSKSEPASSGSLCWIQEAVLQLSRPGTYSLQTLSCPQEEHSSVVLGLTGVVCCYGKLTCFQFVFLQTFPLYLHLEGDHCPRLKGIKGCHMSRLELVNHFLILCFVKVEFLLSDDMHCYFSCLEVCYEIHLSDAMKFMQMFFLISTLADIN